ncbi:hypothetical protein BKI52_13330 [marine bacterium AO1-C]|nr:hypothetical protein BKI52_13330 [marine bacterium AO1-C]
MAERYSRNRPFITETDQEKIRKTKILFGGVGLGSVIAETALRLGFENFCLLDKDTVSLSNLNRQNYVDADVDTDKVTSIKRRLEAINPNVNVEHYKVDLNSENVNDFVAKYAQEDSYYHVAVNALDYDNNAPFIFDHACMKHNIPIIHPANFSWSGATFIIQDQSIEDTIEGLDPTQGNKTFFEVLYFMLETIAKDYNTSTKWVTDVLDDLQKDSTKPIPQAAVGANLVSGLTVKLIFDIIMQRPVKTFPYIYYLSLK